MRCLGSLVRHHATVAWDTHFRNVQTFDFRFLANTISNDGLNNLVNDDRQNAERDEAGDHADELGNELAEASAVEKADHTLFHRAFWSGAWIHHHIASVGHLKPMSAVPALAIGAVTEQADRETPPGTIDTVDGDGAHGIVNFQ